MGSEGERKGGQRQEGKHVRGGRGVTYDRPDMQWTQCMGNGLCVEPGRSGCRDDYRLPGQEQCAKDKAGEGGGPWEEKGEGGDGGIGCKFENFRQGRVQGWRRGGHIER